MIWFGCALGNQKQRAARPPHNTMTCTSGTDCLPYLDEHRLPSGLFARTMASSAESST